MSLLCWKQGVPLFFGCSRPRACAPVTRFGLVFVFGHFEHHGLVSDFAFQDSGVVGPALLAPGRVVTDTRSSHGLRSTELRRSSATSPYVLTIVSSCSADSGLTQPPAAAYASCMTHAVSPSMYLNAPGLASCSSVRPLGHWDR
jgi:hypothetical protein